MPFRLLSHPNSKMATSTLSFLLLLLFVFLFPDGGKSQFLCQSSSCPGADSPSVRFPFRLKKTQDPRCGYQPDFDLFCNNRSQTILTLPYAGEFAVERINYGEQGLWINDPNKCLPRRFLEESFSLRSSPFQFDRSDNVTFLNCSYHIETFMPGRFRKVNCMSGENHTVLALLSRDYPIASASLPAPCPMMKMKRLPFRAIHLEDRMELMWSEPECADCEARGGDCGPKSSSSADVECFNLPKSGLPRGAKYGLIIGVGIPGLLFLFGLGCYICGKFKACARPNHQNTSVSFLMGHRPTSVVAGLDGPTIESFPKTLLGESRRLPKPNDNTCSICLSEYQAKETIRTIPECSHYFHADCIDEWLKLNSTCPVCRNSPDESSVTTTPSSSVSMSSMTSVSLS